MKKCEVDDAPSSQRIRQEVIISCSLSLTLTCVFPGIRQLQLVLLKVTLLLGVEVHTGVEFQGLTEPTGENGICIRPSATSSGLSPGASPSLMSDV